MRKQLCDALLARSKTQEMAFLTGDLGFMALEQLQDALGTRFINTGVAEQNMISVSAAMAREGFETWAYSIAPFCYARPFEQIRNDICFHGLPVKLIGNGGGYGYGVMGPTHHAIEDYGILLTLPNMSVYVPVFDEDLEAVISRMGANVGPAYLRLGRGEPPKDFAIPSYAPWRQLTYGRGMTVIAVGPLAGIYVAAAEALPESRRPNLWAVAELPLSKNPLPDALVEQITAGPGVCIAEEHVARGGFGSELALHLAERGIATPRFRHLCARSHIYDTYGSQNFLREKSGLAAAQLIACITSD
ncbi:UNVERIFIED_ORG: transketolase [Paraburkholderia sediminicola]|nr:transketolase [Paraburkholderia sediminicola]